MDFLSLPLVSPILLLQQCYSALLYLQMSSISLIAKRKYEKEEGERKGEAILQGSLWIKKEGGGGGGTLSLIGLSF